MNDLDRVFEMDSLELAKSDEALTALIVKYRAARIQFKLGDKTAGKKEKLKLSLEDLKVGDV